MAPKQTKKPAPAKQTEKPAPAKQTQKPAPAKQTEKPGPVKQTKISKKALQGPPTIEIAPLQTLESQTVQEKPLEKPLRGKGAPEPKPTGKSAQEKKQTRKSVQNKETRKIVQERLKRDKKVKTVKTNGKKSLKNPDAPKAPAGGAYGVFISKHREEIQKDLSKSSTKTSINAADITKEAGARWNALEEAQKKVYRDQYAAKSEAYKKALEEFKAGGGQTRVVNPAFHGMKLRRNPNAPKVPGRGGYGVFLSEKREELKKGLTSGKVSEVSKTASAKWKALGSPDRRAYKEKYAAKSEAYKKELEQFKAAGGQTRVVDLKVNKRRKTSNKEKEDAEAKRKREDDEARAAIDRIRAARTALVGA